MLLNSMHRVNALQLLRGRRWTTICLALLLIVQMGVNVWLLTGAEGLQYLYFAVLVTRFLIRSIQPSLMPREYTVSDSCPSFM